MRKIKISKIVLLSGIVISFTLSLSYLIKSFINMEFENADFVSDTTFLFSNLTTLVILIFVLRRSYLSERIKPKFLFSWYSLLALLTYISMAVEILVYNIFKYGITNNEFFIEKIITFLFAIFCLTSAIYMLTRKDINKTTVEKYNNF